MGKTSLQAIFAYIWRSDSVFGKRKKSKSVKLNLTHAAFWDDYFSGIALRSFTVTMDQTNLRVPFASKG
jgi:hypothetical protein